MDVADIRRYALIFGLVAVGYLLIMAWSDDHRQELSPEIQSRANAAPTLAGQPDMPTTTPAGQDLPSVVVGNANNPDVPVPVSPGATVPSVPAATMASEAERLIEVQTDVLRLWIDRRGGDIVKTALLDYPVSIDATDVPVVLFDRTDRHIYVAQSGLVGTNGPDSSPTGRPTYRASADSYDLGASRDTLSVDLDYVDDTGVRYTKRFTFHRNDYLVDVEILVDNDSAQPWQGNFFAQMKRDDTEPESNASAMGPQPFVGIALTTPEDSYVKADFDDLEEEPVNQVVDGGWIAILQHYFIGVWIADSEAGANTFFGRKARDGTFLAGYTSQAQVIQPGTTGTFDAQLYVGPKFQDRLRALAPHLDLTVDYGFLWFLSNILFEILQYVHSLTGNWGFAIIGLTLIVKLVLSPLSTASFKSAARMRQVAPEMRRIQERYSDDRPKLSAEMMDLYKREKVNPVGGCFPMLLQMPVFLALYWVLFESVELRQAPFVLWIKDMSIMDPYFVLPALFGAAMFLQTKFNPPMPDPMQQRMMQIMPIMMTVLFVFFPAGLVLYWLVNQILSMAHQWYVMRQFELKSAKPARS